GAPPSLDRMCEDSCARISSPGRQCVAIATWLHIVPDGRNTAASFPSSAALRSHNSQMVGSEPICSSPTSASFMPRDGLVCVSDDRLTRIGIEKSNRFGSYDMVEPQLILRSLRRQRTPSGIGRSAKYCGHRVRDTSPM